MLRRLCILLGLGLLLTAPLAAQDIPPPLRDWQGWVLHDVPGHACPFLADQAREMAATARERARTLRGGR